MELQVEQELADTNESLSDQTCTNQAICGAKMKCEQEMGSMSHDLDEMTAEAHLSEEKAQRAMIDAARLAGELLRNSDRHAEVFQPLIIILQTLICHGTLQILQKKIIATTLQMIWHNNLQNVQKKFYNWQK